MSSLCVPGHLAGAQCLEAEQRIQALRGILLVDSEALLTLVVLGYAPGPYGTGSVGMLLTTNDKAQVMVD